MDTMNLTKNISVPVRSVKKALDALDFVLDSSPEKNGLSLGELSSMVGMKNSAMRNILKTMEICGYIARAEGRLYIPGPKTLQFARLSRNLMPLVEIASPLLAEAAKESGGSFVLTTVLNGERRVLLRAKGGGIVSVETDKTEVCPVYSLVTSRVMLAHLDTIELDYFIGQNGMPGAEWEAVCDKESLLAELKKIRRKLLIEEKGKEIVSMAAPILDAKSSLLGAVGAYAPLPYSDRQSRENLASLVKSLALKISSKIKEKDDAC